MTIADQIQVGALIVQAGALIGLLWQVNESRLQQKISIYRDLEMESNGLFRFEAEFRQELAPYRHMLAPADRSGGDALVARKFYENCCNMFEVATRLRKQGVADAEVYASWIAWFFDTMLEWGFRSVWRDLRDNYTAELRELFDPMIEKMIGEWDLPAAGGKRNGIDEAEIQLFRRQFYAATADVLGCEHIENWLEKCPDLREQLTHPVAVD